MYAAAARGKHGGMSLGPRLAANPALAALAIPLTALMFAGNVVAARVGGAFMPPNAMALGRWLFFVLIMLPFVGAGLWRHRADIRREWWRLPVLGGLGMAICATFPYIAGQTTTATNIGLIYTASPALIILFSGLLLGERMTGTQGLGVLLALAGVLSIILKGSLATLATLTFVPGDLWVLSSSPAWASYCLLLQRWPSALPGQARITAIAAAAVLLMLPVSLGEAVLVRPTPLNWETLGFCLFLAIIPSAGAYLLHGWATSVLGAKRTAMNGYFIPLFGALLGWALLGEQLHLYHLAGAVLVLGGTWLANRRAAG